MNLDSLSKKIWNFFGTHSTNMWLTHMTFAEEFVFTSRNVVVIFLVLIGLYARSINYLKQGA